MSDTAAVRAFPRRAIALVANPAATRRRTLLLVGALLLFLPLIWFGYTTLQERALRADLRARGVEAEVLTADGSCLSRRGITGDTPRGCNLDIRYRVQDAHGGGEREAEVYLPGAAPLVFAPPALYDPEDPDRIMTKADVERGAPFMNVAVPLVLLTLLPLFALLLWFATGRGALKQAAANPHPTIVPIVRAARHAQGNRLDIWFQRPDGGEGLRSYKSGGPLLVAPPPEAPPGQQWALALLTPKGWPILLDQDLKELNLTDEERTTIWQAARD